MITSKLRDFNIYVFKMEELNTVKTFIYICMRQDLCDNEVFVHLLFLVRTVFYIFGWFRFFVVHRMKSHDCTLVDSNVHLNKGRKYMSQMTWQRNIAEEVNNEVVSY